MYVEYTNALIFGRYQFPPFIRTYPKSTSLSFFVPAGTQIGVKLLSGPKIVVELTRHFADKTWVSKVSMTNN